MAKNEESENIENNRIKYQVALGRNNSESELMWTRYNAMLVFNSLLITIIGFIYNAGSTIPSLLIILLPVVGVISCYLWFQTTSRGFQWMRFWIETAKGYEEENKLGKGPITDGDEHQKYIVGWPHTDLASYILILVIAIIYLVFLFTYLDKHSLLNRCNTIDIQKKFTQKQKDFPYKFNLKLQRHEQENRPRL